MAVIAIEDAGDPRLALYRGVSDPALLARHSAFVVEGRLVLQRVITESGLALASVLVTQPALQALAGELALRPDVPVYVAPQEVLNGVAGFNIHRGCLAIGIRRPTPDAAALVDALPPAARVVILDSVSNADNIGGIFRSAAALGASAVLLGPGCGDPLYRKAIRTSIGATLVLPFATFEAWPTTIEMLRARGFETIALTPALNAEPIREAAARLASAARIAVLAGAEGDGLGAEALTLSDIRARIPMAKGVDSLNVTVAVAIALDRLRPVTRGQD